MPSWCFYQVTHISLFSRILVSDLIIRINFHQRNEQRISRALRSVHVLTVTSDFRQKRVFYLIFQTLQIVLAYDEKVIFITPFFHFLLVYIIMKNDANQKKQEQTISYNII